MSEVNSNQTWVWGGPAGVPATGTMSGTNKINSIPIMIPRGAGASWTATWTGTPTGSFGVEVSNEYDPQSNPNSTAWIPVGAARIVVSGTQPAGAAGSLGVELLGTSMYKAARLVYTNTSGAGNVSALAFAKGL